MIPTLPSLLKLWATMILLTLSWCVVTLLSILLLLTAVASWVVGSMRTIFGDIAASLLKLVPKRTSATPNPTRAPDTKQYGKPPTV